MEEIAGLMDAHAHFKATLGEADKEHQSIVGLVREVETIVKQHQIPGGLENPYTALTAHELTKKWTDVRQLVPRRDETLAAELRKQQSILFTVIINLVINSSCESNGSINILFTSF